jgi:hypothetical protein
MMSDWNEQSAPNNNLSSGTLKTSKFANKKRDEHPFSEELSDGGERDQFIKEQRKS